MTKPCATRIAIFKRRLEPGADVASTDREVDEHAAGCLTCMAREWQMLVQTKRLDPSELARSVCA